MTQTTPPGWYHGEGDPDGTLRWWDGSQWIGDPQTNMGVQGGPVSALPGSSSSDRDASALRRIIGRLVDFLILMVPALVLIISSIDIDGLVDAFEELETAPTGDVAAQTAFQDSVTKLVEDGVSGASMAMAIFFLAVWLIEALMIKMLGATPGKLMTGTRVRSAETEEAVSWLQAVLRTSLRLLSVLVYAVVALSGLFGLIAMCISIVSLIMLFAVDRHQTLMDKIARTVVLKRSAVQS